MRDLFCEKCGRRLDEDDLICPLCHTVIAKAETEAEFSSEVRISNKFMKTIGVAVVRDEEYESFDECEEKKSRLVAGFLQIFLGAIGMGRFYLGYTTIGILQIVASFFSCGIGGFVWGFVDGIRILMGKPENDSNGNALAD